MNLLAICTKEEVIERLKVLNKRGYRYVTRDGSGWLFVYSHKPKKYMKDGQWGYRLEDLDKPDALPAEPIANEDMPEIAWKNRYPILIIDLIEGELQ